MVTFDNNAIVCAAIGIILLGVSTSLNYIIRGKVTGMSGIAYGIISLNKCTTLIYHSLTPREVDHCRRHVLYFFHFLSHFWQHLSQWVLAFRARKLNRVLDNLPWILFSWPPRFSVRSLVAVCTFLFAAISLSTLASYVGLGPFVDDSTLSPTIDYNHTVSSICILIVGLILPIIGYVVAKKYGSNFASKSQLTDQLIVFIVGVIFAIGLMVSGMSRRMNILQFLQLN